MTASSASTQLDQDVRDLLEAFDEFDELVLCEVSDCAADKIHALHAVMLLVVAMPCCSKRLPVCIPHRQQLLDVAQRHATIYCGSHRAASCAHDVVSFEPLP